MKREQILLPKQAESIRVSSKIKNKFKKEMYKMINRETKKYEPSIIVDGGV